MNMQPLTTLPLSVTEIDRLPSFRSPDADVVRAAIYLLDAAWRSDKPGTLMDGLDDLAHLARLSVDKLQSHWEVLFDGWVLQDDGRLAYPRMVDVWLQMSQTYGDALRRMELASIVMQNDAMSASPDGFDLLGPIPSQSKSNNKGKKIYPSDFQPNEASIASMERSGYMSHEERAWLLERFGDFGRAQRRMYADWQAAFRNFLGSSMTKRDFRDHFGYVPGTRPVQALGGTSALARLRMRASGASGRSNESSIDASGGSGGFHNGGHQHQPLADTFAQRQLGNARTMFAAAAAKRGLVSVEHPQQQAPAEGSG